METAPKHFNSGYGPQFQVVDIAHDKYVAVISPDTAFWSLVDKSELADYLSSDTLINAYSQKAAEFEKEMETLRFGLKPSAVYFNPTERCNLNCTYCYIPEEMRKNGPHMSEDQLLNSLEILKNYFKTTVPEGRLPQIIFHGSEPMMNKEAMFKGISEYKDFFHFGIQTNASLLDDEAIEFIKENGVGIGISIDGPTAEIGNKARKDWAGEGYFEQAASVIEKLKDHTGFNVICTVTTENMEYLSETVDFFHDAGVKICMLNIVRCTQERSRTVKPDDETAAKHFMKALDRTHELYKKTGRKIIVANFANILIGILAPSARRLMCDISPCGGGRCFFALAANGDMFPCSEFVGVPEFKGGNMFEDKIEDVLKTDCFRRVSERMVEDIDPCDQCAIKHFCGAPCPAEAYTMHDNDIDTPGAFCEFYEEQVRYAFRLIANGIEDDFLFNGWDADTATVFDAETMLL